MTSLQTTPPPTRHDPAQNLRRATVAGSVLLVFAVIMISVWSVRQAGQQLLTRDLAAAEAIAEIVDGLPTDDRSAAVARLGDHGIVALLTPDDRAIPSDLGTGEDGPLWRRWTGLVVRTSKVRDTFQTRDPDGRQWSHVTAPTDDGGRILIQRPSDDGAVISDVVLRGFLGGGGGIVVLFAALWAASRRGFLDPLDRTIEASEDLRWRGRLRPAERERLGDLGRRSDQVGRLSNSLLAVDDDIARNVLQLSTLLETSRSVAGSLEPDEVFNNILLQMRRLFDTEHCAVLHLDTRANLFVIRASLGLSEEFVSELRVAPTTPDSPAMRALRAGQPVQISDMLNDRSYARLRSRAGRAGFRSLLAIPLVTSVAPPAVLLVYKREPYRYSYSELELASSFVGFASMAMENASLYARIDERLQEQTRRLEAIVESLDDGLILADPDGTIAYHNPAAADLLGLDPSELTGARADEVLHRLGQRLEPSDDEERSTAPVVISRGQGRDYREISLRRFTVTDEHGAPLGQGQLWQDVTEDRAVERMKSALLATVSHELRAPLANITGYVSTLLADDVHWEAGDQLEFLTTIKDETDRLMQLVSDVLDVSRIEAGMVTLTREPVLPRGLLDRISETLPPQGQDRIDVRCPRDLPAVDIDRARIEIVARNLIDNALKFSPPDSPVEVSADVVDDAFILTVRDHGPGIPEELKDRVFDSFVRGDEGLTRQAGGFGLGLAICRGFVEAHGGHLTLWSAEPGARFRVVLPLQRTREEDQ